MASGAVEPGFWWVNQSRAYEVERNGGYVYAGKFTANGRVVRHHSDLTKLVPGDVTLHAARGQLRAVGRVTGTAATGIYTPPGRAAEEGWRAPVIYRELTRPIPCRKAQLTFRPQPPFNRNGTLRQRRRGDLLDWRVARTRRPTSPWSSSSCGAQDGSTATGSGVTRLGHQPPLRPTRPWAWS